MSEQEQIREKGLKATPVRVRVLEALQQEHIALSHADVERTIGKVDRITLYRALNDFEEAGLVHKIVDSGGVTRFAVCGHACPGSTHVEAHIHFSCLQCGKMFCLDHTGTPAIKLPPGFTAQGINTIVQGICRECGNGRNA